MKITVSLTGIAVAAVLLFGAHGSVSAEAATTHPTTSDKVVVEVQKGDSLSKIAHKHDSTYQRLFYANTYIEDPNVIHPGDKIRVPNNDEKLKERTIPNKASVQSAKPNRSAASKPQSQKSTKATARRAAPKQTSQSAQVNGGVWDKIANCESSGNWSINTGNGYYGGLQFTLSSWRAAGGKGYPHQASKQEQIARAQKLQAIQGWGAWPACTSKLGLR